MNILLTRPFSSALYIFTKNGKRSCTNEMDITELWLKHYVIVYHPENELNHMYVYVQNI